MMIRDSKLRRSTVDSLTAEQKAEIQLATERAIAHLMRLTERIRELGDDIHPLDLLPLMRSSKKYFNRLMLLGKGTMNPPFHDHWCRQTEVQLAARRIAKETGADEGIVYARLRSLMGHHIRTIECPTE